MATIYNWDDAGSPGRSLTGNLQNKFRQILRACLVDGYAGKPAAGWSVVHEHANGFSLRNGPDTGIVNFVSGLSGWDESGVGIFLAESASDTSGAIIQGVNLRSGAYIPEANAAATRHMLYPDMPLQNSLESLRWTVIADDRTFILSISSGYVGNNCDFVGLYVGEIQHDFGLTGTATFCAFGGTNYWPTNYGTEAYTFRGGVTALRDLGTGLVGGETLPYVYPFSTRPGGYVATQLPVPAPARLSLSPARVHGGGTAGWVGRLRGVVCDELVLRYRYDAARIAVGSSQFNAVADLGDIEVVASAGLDGSCYLTADPRFW